ncbi:pentapeptide repeat-containing protein [Herbiconiux sp. A18JL235]|uniref:Pentapeptide repeat-containing protein n=1 Tax=Herbiconiux sp. A18JL235 TaxID=3152363 RepID=A0AB39BLC7_9MICO
MPVEPVARIRSLLLTGLVAGFGATMALAGAGAAVPARAAEAAPAAVVADPLFDDGACVVLPTTDGGGGGAQCAGVDLSGTRFGEADFRGANLTGASFVDGDVQGAVFTGADLTGADFTGARIVGADFTGSSILPATLQAEADASGTATVAIEPVTPAGLTLDGCTIVGTPVESGQAFPVGTSNMVCTISSSFTGTATALVAIEVAPPATPVTSEPLFTDPPSTPAAGDDDELNVAMVIGFIGGGLLLVLGIAAFVFANRGSGGGGSGRRSRGRESGSSPRGRRAA